MIVTCWSVKGGSGASVVAAGLAVAWASDRPVLAVDLAGDLPAVLGMTSPVGPGVLDWLHAGSGVGGAALEALAVDAAPGLRVLHRGGAAGGSGHAGSGLAEVADVRWRAFTEAMAAVPGDVVIDAGLAPLPPEVAPCSDASLLVIRRCFLALRRASMTPDVPTGVVVIAEPGRALARRDVELALGIRTVAEMRLDPAVARAVDAGLLVSRLPASLGRLAGAVDRWATREAAPGPPRPEPLPGLSVAAEAPAPAMSWAGWR